VRGVATSASFSVDLQYNDLIYRLRIKMSEPVGTGLVSLLACYYFDLELGQKLEAVYPLNHDLSKEEERTIGFHAFPVGYLSVFFSTTPIIIPPPSTPLSYTTGFHVLRASCRQKCHPRQHLHLPIRKKHTFHHHHHHHHTNLRLCLLQTTPRRLPPSWRRTTLSRRPLPFSYIISPPPIHPTCWVHSLGIIIKKPICSTRILMAGAGVQSPANPPGGST
jgi:hypothetical protein